MKALRYVWLSLFLGYLNFNSSYSKESKDHFKAQNLESSTPEASIHKEVKNFLKREGITLEQLYDLTSGNKIDQDGRIYIPQTFNWNLKLNEIKLLVKLTEDVHNLNTHRQNVLLQVVSTSVTLTPEILEYFLSKGLSPFLANSQGQTLVLQVVKTKNKAVIKTLLDSGIDVNSKDDMGHTLLQYLVVISSKEGPQSVEAAKPLLTYLIEMGADVNFVDKNLDQNSLLHFAGLDGSVEMMKHLLEKGANANVLNKEGLTPAQAIRFVKGVFECEEMGVSCSSPTYIVNSAPDINRFKKRIQYDNEELAREDLQKILAWIENTDIEGTWARVNKHHEEVRKSEEHFEEIQRRIKEMEDDRKEWESLREQMESTRKYAEKLRMEMERHSKNIANHKEVLSAVQNLQNLKKFKSRNEL